MHRLSPSIHGAGSGESSGGSQKRCQRICRVQLRPRWQVRQDEWLHCRTSERTDPGTKNVFGGAPPGSGAEHTLSSTSQIVTSSMQERGRTGVTLCLDRCGRTGGTENRIWYFQNQAGRCRWKCIDPGTAPIMAVVRWVALHSAGLLQDSCGRSIPQTAVRSPPTSAVTPAELEPIPGAHGYPHNSLLLATVAS